MSSGPSGDRERGAGLSLEAAIAGASRPNGPSRRSSPVWAAVVRAPGDEMSSGPCWPSAGPSRTSAPPRRTVRCSSAKSSGCCFYRQERGPLAGTGPHRGRDGGGVRRLRREPSVPAYRRWSRSLSPTTCRCVGVGRRAPRPRRRRRAGRLRASGTAWRRRRPGCFKAVWSVDPAIVRGAAGIGAALARRRDLTVELPVKRSPGDRCVLRDAPGDGGDEPHRGLRPRLSAEPSDGGTNLLTLLRFGGIDASAMNS